MKHAEVHPTLNVEGCFGCKVAGVRMGMNTTTTRGASVGEANAREKRWNADMPAYKRLRQQGLQPRSVDGASFVEKHADHRWQVEGAAALPVE